MLFSSPVFLFLFLPLVLSFYFVLWRKFRNYYLLLASLIFFAWGGVSYTALLLISITFNYLIGLGVGKDPGSLKSRRYLALGVMLNVTFLAIFKYADFVVGNLNLLSGILDFKPFGDPGIILPIGISFYTFHAMSYIIDVYRGVAKVQKNPFHLGLYITFFPQLIAGPILRYHDIAPQITGRQVTLDGFTYGIRRFIIGLGKKVLIANHMGLIADTAFGTPVEQLSGPLAWLGLITYALQIYFDFSGYSDMAIGLGKMFGFTFMENFNYPYISRSIKEFWRRWHISLSTWFRDYLYVPLGGNRKGNGRTYFNLYFVFFVTGLWHGASWSFVLWGFMHGTFLILERLLSGKFPDKLWRPLQHLYTLFVALMAWVLFRAEDIGYAWDYYAALFGQSNASLNIYTFSKIMNAEFILFFVIGLLSASGLLVWLNKKIDLQVSRLEERSLLIAESYRIAQVLFFTAILAICSMYLITTTYNPFIYYRF
ncbi:MAG: MBOAT family protein [Bacteroidales bacterium]|nr:MBOAT family protein [Bacteroidales bacterium]